MPELYLIRHGEPATTGVLVGQCDPPLSSAGRMQADGLRAPAARAIYASPLRRASETALSIRRDIVVVPDLAEISYGLWDGLSWLEIEQRWPEMAAQKLAAWTEVTPPQGEPWNSFQARVLSALSSVLKGPLPAIIVAHEAVNAVIAERIASSNVSEFRQDYCEIKSYEV